MADNPSKVNTTDTPRARLKAARDEASLVKRKIDALKGRIWRAHDGCEAPNPEDLRHLAKAWVDYTRLQTRVRQLRKEVGL